MSRCLILALTVIVAAAGCSWDDVLETPAPGEAGPAGLAVRFVPARPAYAMAAAPDRAWVHVSRMSGEAVADTVVALPADGSSVRVAIELEVTSGQETFAVVVEMREGNIAVSRGMAVTDVTRGTTTTADIALSTDDDQLAVGANHTCALNPSGAAYCWGINHIGQLGNGSSNPISAQPVPVAGGHRFITLSGGTAGAWHTCGIAIDGEAFCWGANNFGQLGDGTTQSATSPRPVSGTDRLRRISSSYFHTCALDIAGEILCWGSNNVGQLGTGGPGPDQLVPTRISEPGPYRTVSAGFRYTCALTVAGELRCWGFLFAGRPAQPTSVPGPFISISSGGNHACGLVESGAAYCWGRNAAGELGDGTTQQRDAAVAVSGGHRFVRIVAGNSETCGLTPGGEVHCWGFDLAGLVRGQTHLGTVPTLRIQGRAYRSIGSDSGDGCGVHDHGVDCWGSVTWGRLGNADDGISFPTPVTTSQPFRTIGAGQWQSCGLTIAGEAYCWGLGYYGGLGNGSNVSHATPQRVVGGITFESISVGVYSVCGLTPAGRAYCWGVNTFGGTGTGGASSDVVLMPTPVVGGLTFAQISSNFHHTCAIEAGTRTAYCWGRNISGQLGNGGTVDSSTPVPVTGGHAFSSITAGWYHTCGITTVGAALCWGLGRTGQLGTGSTSDSAVPVAVAGGLTFSALAAGNGITCGIASNGSLYCWGTISGQSLVPTPQAAGHAFRTVRVHNATVCGITTSASAVCFGANSYGQLATGTVDFNTNPTPVTIPRSYVSIEPGAGHVCGITTAGAPLCWGSQLYGALGDGNLGFAFEPVPAMTW